MPTTIVAVCSCGYTCYNAAEMNNHGVGNPVHYWTYVPDIIITETIDDGKGSRIHRRLKPICNS